MAENFFSILKPECINRYKLSSFSQARSLIDDFIWFYNNERIQLSQDHRFNRWLAPPLKGVITGLAPKRGTELYYRITRTATRERVTRFLPMLCDNFKHGFNVSWTCIKLALFLVAPLFFLPPVEPGVYFHV